MTRRAARARRFAHLWTSRSCKCRSRLDLAAVRARAWPGGANDPPLTIRQKATPTRRESISDRRILFQTFPIIVPLARELPRHPPFRHSAYTPPNHQRTHHARDISSLRTTGYRRGRAGRDQGVARVGLGDHRAEGAPVRGRVRGGGRREARRGGQLLHGGHAPVARGDRPAARRRGDHHALHLRGDRRGGALLRRAPGAGRRRPADAEHARRPAGGGDYPAHPRGDPRAHRGAAGRPGRHPGGRARATCR